MPQLEKLVVSLEARVNQYEKALAKAQRTTDAQFTRIEQRGMRLDGRLASVGKNAFLPFIAGATAALAPILSVAAALNTAKAALNDFDKIAKTAKASGLDSDFFQELSYAADLGGVSMSELASATATFTKNAGMAAEGKGRMVTQLKVLNPELLKAIQNATSQEQRIRLVADALEKEADASRKAAIASAAFGDAGMKMVEMLRGGSSALDETARKARDLGLVIDRDLLARAEQMNDEFGTAQKVIDLNFKQALINLAPWLIHSAQLIGNLARALNIVVDQFKAIEDRTVINPLQNKLADVHNRRFGLGDEIARMEAEMAALGKDNPVSQMLTFTLRGKKEEFAALTAEADQLLSRITELQGRGREPGSSPLNLPETPDTPETDNDRPVYTRNQAATAAMKQAEAVRNLVADLRHEQDQLGRTADQQELYNALKSAGVTLESAHGQEIAAAMTALQAQRAEIEANVAAMEMFENAADQALNTLVDGLLEGKDAGEIFRNVLGDIGRQLLNMGISGLSGGFGSMLFPGVPRREFGGPVKKGQPYIVGEKRAELFVPSQNGTILPRVPDASAARMGGGDALSFPFAPMIDARGADIGVVARLEQMVARQAAEFEGRVKQIVKGRGSKWR